MNHFFRLAVLSLALVAVAQGQQAPVPPVRVRGTVQALDGETLTLATPKDGAVKLAIGPNTGINGLVAKTVADIGDNTFIGTTAVKDASGRWQATEVHIFPESMRGVGDGHRGWDLQPTSTMTNGNVEQSSASSDGQVLTLKYKDGEKKILVPADTPIVTYVTGEVSELKPGAPIFISAATKQPDGTLKTPRVNVGRGVAPPM